MLKKKYPIKAMAIMLSLLLSISICFIPTAVLAESAAESHTFTFENGTFACNATITEGFVGGGAYALSTDQHKSGQSALGIALNTSSYNGATRATKFNNGSNFTQLAEDSIYMVTYSYYVTNRHGEEGSTNYSKYDSNYDSTSSITFIENTKGSSATNVAGTALNLYDGTEFQLLDYKNAETNTWITKTVYIKTTVGGVLGINTTGIFAKVYLDDITFTRINVPTSATTSGQPEVFDFDSHDFADGIAYNSSNAISDGVGFEHYYSDTAIIGTSKNAPHVNVVGLESGISRSYSADSTATNAYKYSDVTAYPTLNVSEHKNVLCISPNSYTGGTGGKTRGFALNNGTDVLSLDAGTYEIKFDFYYAHYNGSGSRYLTLISNFDVYCEKADSCSAKTGTLCHGTTVCGVNGDGTMSTGAVNLNPQSGWTTFCATVNFSEAVNSIGFQYNGITIGEELFIDNISITKKFSGSEEYKANLFNFDSANESIALTFDATKVIGGSSLYGIASDTVQGNVLKAPIKGNSTNRGLILNDGSNQFKLPAGDYTVSFKYKIEKREDVTNTVTDETGLYFSVLTGTPTDATGQWIGNASIMTTKIQFGDDMLKLSEYLQNVDTSWHVCSGEFTLDKESVIVLASRVLPGVLSIDDIIFTPVGDANGDLDVDICDLVFASVIHAEENDYAPRDVNRIDKLGADYFARIRKVLLSK